MSKRSIYTVLTLLSLFLITSWAITTNSSFRPTASESTDTPYTQETSLSLGNPDSTPNSSPSPAQEPTPQPSFIPASDNPTARPSNVNEVAEKALIIPTAAPTTSPSPEPTATTDSETCIPISLHIVTPAYAKTPCPSPKVIASQASFEKELHNALIKNKAAIFRRSTLSSYSQSLVLQQIETALTKLLKSDAVSRYFNVNELAQTIPSKIRVLPRKDFSGNVVGRCITDTISRRAKRLEIREDLTFYPQALEATVIHETNHALANNFQGWPCFERKLNEGLTEFFTVQNIPNNLSDYQKYVSLVETILTKISQRLTKLGYPSSIDAAQQSRQDALKLMEQMYYKDGLHEPVWVDPKTKNLISRSDIKMPLLTSIHFALQGGKLWDQFDWAIGQKGALNEIERLLERNDIKGAQNYINSIK